MIFDRLVLKQFAAATEAALQSAREWFVEFAIDENIQ